MVLKIKDLPKEERPYEKLAYYGVEALSNEELLAILLKTGYRDISSKDLANILLKKAGSVVGLTQLKYSELCKIKGIGMSKAAILLATFELAKRVELARVQIKKHKLNSSKMVFEYYASKIGNKKQEHFYVVYLDNAKKIIDDKLLFIGTINYSVVHPREVFKEAYLLSASALICVHNHPSGNVFPSPEDLKLTNDLAQVGHILGIKLLDHIIIGNKQYYSLLENGDLKS